MSVPVLEPQVTDNDNCDSYDKVERQVIEDARIFSITVVPIELTLFGTEMTIDGRAV